MAVGAERYTPEQREALGQAAAGGRTAPEVVALAAAGKLLSSHGEPLEPFEVPASTVRHLKRRHSRQATAAPLEDAPPRDAIENLRRRLVRVIEVEIEEVERVSAEKRGVVKPERLRQLGRALLELARVPGPSDPRPQGHAVRDANGRRGPETRGGLAGRVLREEGVGALLQAHRASPPAPVTPPARPLPVTPPPDY